LETPVAHSHNRSSWVTVLVLIVAAILLALALPMQSIPLGIAAVVLGLIGLVMAWRFKVMEDAS
jgi:multidrug transporter EmrE-like cation transporter